jgi:hypothetical protein
MGKTRICGKQCHNAKSPKCRCWCGGTFHGADGEAARATFATSFSLAKLPTTESAFDHLTHPNLFHDDAAEWRARVDAGVAAQELARTVAKRRHRRPRGE